MPPALNIVNKITDLRVVEYGDKLMIEFTIPDMTTDQLPVRKIAEVDLRIGTGPDPFDMNRWADSARKLDVTAAAPGSVQAETPAHDWIGKTAVISVRVKTMKGRLSDWSNLGIIPVVDPLKKAQQIQAEPDAVGVKLTWQTPASKARIFRRADVPNEKLALLDTVEGKAYIDKTAEYGKPYEYRVQVFDPGAESEVSDAILITPKDTFPPAAPVGLQGVPGIGSVELVWERNTEADLRGYRIYRAAEGADFVRIAEFVDTPAYSDRQVEAGKKFRYAITALDVTANESPRSAVVEVTAP